MEPGPACGLDTETDFDGFHRGIDMRSSGQTSEFPIPSHVAAERPPLPGITPPPHPAYVAGLLGAPSANDFPPRGCLTFSTPEFRSGRTPRREARRLRRSLETAMPPKATTQPPIPNSSRSRLAGGHARRGLAGMGTLEAHPRDRTRAHPRGRHEPGRGRVTRRWRISRIASCAITSSQFVSRGWGSASRRVSPASRGSRRRSTRM